MSDLYSELSRKMLMGSDMKPLSITFTSKTMSVLNHFILDKGEGTILDQFSITTHYLRSGSFPPSAPSIDNIAIQKTKDRVLTRKQECELIYFIQNEPIEIVIDCIRQLNELGISLPHSCITTFNKISNIHPRYSDLISDCLGERGAWLANNLKSWRLPSTIEAENLWIVGSFAKRRELFAMLRFTSPIQANVLLMSTLHKEKSADLMSFCKLFAINVGDHDTDIVLKIMNTKNARVKHSCLKLLSLFATHPLLEKAKTDIHSILCITSLKCNPQLSIQLPDDYEPHWKDLGIEQDPDNLNGAVNIHWLHQLLCLFSPTDIASSLLISLNDLTKEVQKNPYKDSLLKAFRSGARLHADYEFIKKDIIGLPLNIFIRAYEFYSESHDPEIHHILEAQCEHFVRLLLLDETAQTRNYAQGGKTLIMLFNVIGPLSEEFSNEILTGCIIPRELNMGVTRKRQLNLRFTYKLLSVMGNEEQVYQLIDILQKQNNPPIKIIKTLKRRLRFTKSIKT